MSVSTPARPLSAACLKDTLSTVFTDRPDFQSVKRLIQQSHRIAIAYLQQRARRGYLRADDFGLSIEDLALDCFAGLFQRDDAGRFELLEHYFRGMDWRRMDESGLQMAFRRLVFSKVNEGLFRRYRELDPGLAKIIRNIKKAAKANADVQLVRTSYGLWIVAGDRDVPVRSQPVPPPEVLEAHLFTALCRSNQLQEIIHAFVAFTKENPQYSCGYPLVGFAQMIRSSFSRIGEQPDEEQITAPFLESEWEKALAQTTRSVQADMYNTYVSKKKVDAYVFDTYFKAIRTILAAQFFNGATHVESFFDALQMHLPGLTKESYREKHQHILEYLTKVSRAHLFQYLKSEL